MARALENPDAKPTYLDFFGMTRPPFAKLSESSQMFHSDQYSLLAEHLASATEQSDFLLVICGADGAGKTALLNRHVLSLDEDVSYATFDETCADGTQFYRAFLKQLGFYDITGKLNELKNIAREFLIHRGTAGDSVLLIIDNAHLVCPSVLEQLRWIADTKVNYRRVLSIVLAGNYELPRIMGSPAMKKLEFQRHVDFNIRVYSKQETEDYVRHRLRLSGGADATKLSNDAYPAIYRFTGGIPNSINALCNAVLTEACALDTRVITGDLIRTVADACDILPHVVPQQDKGRRKTDPDVSPAVPEQHVEERIIAREPPPKPVLDSPAAESAVDVKDLLNQISQLSGQLAVQTKKAETLSHTVTEYEDMIKGLNQALSNTEQGLGESEGAASQLTAKADKKAITKIQTDLTDGPVKTASSHNMPGHSNTQTADSIATIEVIRNRKIERVINIAECPSRIMIGRGDDCELRLDSKFVSRHHALIFLTAERVYIEDLNSFNGTVVNAKKVARCILHPDDKVAIGDFQLRPRTAVKNDPV